MIKCLTTCCAIRAVCLSSQFILVTKKGAGNRVHTSMCEEQKLQVKSHWQWCKSKNLQKRHCWSPGRGSCDGADSFLTCLEKACFFTSGQAWRESCWAVLEVRLYYRYIILSTRLLTVNRDPAVQSGMKKKTPTATKFVAVWLSFFFFVVAVGVVFFSIPRSCN